MMESPRRRTVVPASRPDPLRPVPHAGRALTLGIVGGLLVIALGLVVTHAAGWTSDELRVLQWFSSHQVPALNTVALGIAWLFAPTEALALTVLGTLAVLAVSRDPWRAGTFLLVVALSWGSSKVVKMIVARPRPDGALLAHPLAIEHSASFPSGHVCFAAALAIGILVTMRDTRRRSRVIAIVVAGVGVVIVALSRLYVGVHYPTDVIGAIVYVPSAAAVLLWLWLDVVLPRLPRSTPGRRVAASR
ncbi:MAG TPA: phosphatase PAP2 family protein [Microbacteriaceae bacterium]|nr:phosphatase PAP2 family protein [Microbacteriaceae bacterium]